MIVVEKNMEGEGVGYRRFQLLYLPRNTGLSIYSADQSRPYR